MGDVSQSWPILWKQMRRLAGPDLEVTEELKLSVMHDVQRFVVEAFEDWSINTDDEIDLLVRWRGHDDDERTWEPLEQLMDDVPVLVAKYVRAHDDEPDLVRVYNKCKRKASRS